MGSDPFFSCLELLDEVDAPAARLGLEDEAAGREFRVVLDVVEVALPAHDRPAVALYAKPPVEQVDRVAHGAVLRIPPRIAEALVVGSRKELEAGVAECTSILGADVDRIFGDERCLVTYRRRGGGRAPRFDFAVGIPVTEVELEVVAEASVQVQLESLVVDGIETTQVLR